MRNEELEYRVDFLEEKVKCLFLGIMLGEGGGVGLTV